MRNQRFGRDDTHAERDGVIYNPVLHEAHPDDLAAASDELRQRTMSLEPPASVPAKAFVAILIACATAAVVCTFKFRNEIRMMLGLA